MKYKWWLTAIVGIAVGAAVAFCLLATPLYEAETEIYPLVMKKETDKMTLNPCYQVQRIVHSRQFRQLMMDAEISPSLCEGNYDRRIAYHETPRHTLVITVRAESPETAEALSGHFLSQIDYVADYLTSVQMNVDSNFVEEISWDYYHFERDFAPESPVMDRCDSSRVHFLFDVLTPPTSSAKSVYPPDLLKTMVLTFVIAAFLSLVGAWLVEEIRNRISSSRNAQE